MFESEANYPIRESRAQLVIQLIKPPLLTDAAVGLSQHVSSHTKVACWGICSGRGNRISALCLHHVRNV